MTIPTGFRFESQMAQRADLGLPESPIDRSLAREHGFMLVRGLPFAAAREKTGATDALDLEVARYKFRA
jgi:hypothetical protein